MAHFYSNLVSKSGPVFGVLIVSLSFGLTARAYQACDVWSKITSPNAGVSDTFITGVDGAADDDVWSVGWYRRPVGSGQVDLIPYSMRWDGSQWNTIPVPEPPHDFTNKATFQDVTAVSRNDVWAVGDYVPPGGVNTIETLVMHWNGINWNQVASPGAQIGSGSSFLAADSRNGELWAVGYSTGAGGKDNMAAHWNGAGWDTYFPVRNGPGQFELSGVDILNANEVWAIGRHGNLNVPYVTRWDGSSWNEVMPRIDSNLYRGLSSIIVFGPDNVWVGASRVDENRQFLYLVFLHFDGSSWTETPTVAEYHSPRFEGTDPNDFYSASYGTLAHFDGNQWNLVGSIAANSIITDSTVLPSGTVWGAGNTFDTGIAKTLTARWIPCPPTLLGDVNLDGAVTLLDVSPFVSVLTSGKYQAEADINEDAAVNLLDVKPFVDLLSGQ